MKTLLTIFLLFLSLFAGADTWVQKADFGGGKRHATFSFSIGNKGYVGAGQDTTNFHQFIDFWEYDPSSDIWTQKANYGGGATYVCVGFSILNKGYAGLGSNNHFEEYDPSTNTWTAKANYPAANYYRSVSFTIGNFGYVCTGNYSAYLWEYDPSLDLWTQKNNFPVVGRSGAIGFSIGAKAYVGCGISSSLNLYNDFWEYDTLTNSWAQKANLLGPARCDAAGFSICNKGYIAVGDLLTGYLTDLWEYDPVANQWAQKTNVPGPVRDEPAYFVIGDKAYLGTGGDFQTPVLKDFYEYTPDACDIGEGITELSSSAFQFQVSPNPAHGELRLTPIPSPKERGAAANSRCEIYIMDVYGKKVYSFWGDCFASLAMTPLKIDVSGLSEGLYFIVADDGRERAVRKFVKE